MAFTKYASLESAQVLDLKGSASRVKTASLNKLADFEDYRTEDGYLYARIRAISSRVNKNHDGWPSVELAGSQDIFDRHHSAEGGFTIEASKDREYGFSTFLGKPIFVDHHNSNPERARGVIVDAKLHVEDHKTASLDSYYSSPDVDPEHLPGTWVELLLEVDAKSFPRLAKAIIDGSRNPGKGIDGFSMGCDVERSVCNICKNAAASPEDFCNHVRAKGNTFETYGEDGNRRTAKSYENCYGIKFFEISAVFDPADETALLREVRSSVTKEADVLFPPCPMCQKVAGFKNYPFANDMLECNGCSHIVAAKDLADQFNSLTMNHDLDVAGLPQTQHPLGEHTGAEYASEPAPGEDPELDQWASDLQDTRARHQEHRPEGMGLFEVAQAYAGGDQQMGQVLQRMTGKPPAEFMAGMAALFEPTEGYAPGSHGDIYGNPDRFARVARRVLADAPLPQADLPHAPQEIDTLREEKVCPVCGSAMDEETCDVCNYTEPPENFQNPDLQKAQETDLRMDENEDANPEGTEQSLEVSGPGGGPIVENSPRNPGVVSHVTGDMAWEVSIHPKLAGRINQNETPANPASGPVTDEPTDTVLKDQAKPVTSSVRTASDFIAVAGATRRNNMNHTADAASGAPAVAKPDVNTDVEAVGGVDQASNEEASKADAQVTVTDKGGTGVEGVAADSTTSVEQGNEHSKNVESIPTKTFDDGSSGVERQTDPVTNEVFEGAGKRSRWTIEGHDDAEYPGDEIAGGSAAQGTKPADPVGNAQDRVDVLDHVTSPGNNSGPTTTWSGTDGNGVTRQQDPVTNESIALGESGMHNSHVFTAFKLADLEVELGLLDSSKKYERAAELEKTDLAQVQASLSYAQKVKTAGLAKSSKKTASRLPVLGRNSSVTASEPVEESTSNDVDPEFALGA